MSYTKTNWRKNDIITAARLNNMETGIEAVSGGATIGVVNASADPNDILTTILDKNYNEIVQMMSNCIFVVVKDSYSNDVQNYVVTECYYDEEYYHLYNVKIVNPGGSIIAFTSSSATGVLGYTNLS